MTERAEVILGLLPRKSRWNAVCTITPEQAKRLLESQPVQRPISQAHIDALVIEMKAGRFVRSNEALAFDEDGLLFDGQHRLWACFESGFSIEALVCFNEPRDNFEIIGSIVRKRTTGDFLVMEGEASDLQLGTLIGSAGKFLWGYDTGKNPALIYTYRGWSNDEMRGSLVRHPGLIARASELRNIRMLFPRSVLIALTTLMHEADPAKTTLFLHQTLTGEGLSSGDPALTLRSSVSSNYLKRGARIEMAYRIVRAWNAFYEGRTINKLYGSNSAGTTARSRKDGLDPFPRIAGHPANTLRGNKTKAAGNSYQPVKAGATA